LSAKKQSLGLVMRLLGWGTMACHVDPGISFFNTPVGSFRIGLTHLAAGPRRNPRTDGDSIAFGLSARKL
jgi:hypothetical protein